MTNVILFHANRGEMETLLLKSKLPLRNALFAASAANQSLTIDIIKCILVVYTNYGDKMEISTKQLRIQPGKIISIVNSGQDVTVTYRGKPSAKIIPISKKNIIDPKVLESDNELFGLWKDREDIENVDQYVRNLRKGRKF